MSVDSIAKYGALLAVAEEGSLTAAGRHLGYTQSGVSRIIKELEAECGFALLTRGKKGSRLTREGEALIAPIRGLLNAAEQLDRTVDRLKGLRRGSVRVGMISGAALRWAPELAEGFGAVYPDIKLSIFEGTNDDIEAGLMSGGLDCGFIIKPEQNALDFIELMHDRLLAVVPESHPFAGLDAVPLTSLSEAELITCGVEAEREISRLFSKAGASPRVRCAFGDGRTAIAMALCGMGAAILPGLMLTEVSDKVRILPLEPPAERVLGLAYPHGPGRGEASPAARAFIDYVEKRVNDIEP